MNRNLPGAKRFSAACLALSAFWVARAWAAYAQLEVLPAGEPQRVFGNGARPISVIWHNRGPDPASQSISMRLYQTSPATAAPVEFAPWKRLDVLPGQRVLESAALAFPAVRAKTAFLVQWLGASNQVLGVTELWDYPQDLLKELKALSCGKPVGVFDSADTLKPLLDRFGIEYVDLEEGSIEAFRGPLAIIGPFRAKSQMPAGVARAIKTLAGNGVAVVWNLPPAALDDELQPSFYSIPEKTGMIVVAQSALTAGLADNPASQLNLLQLARIATRREQPRLPYLTPP